MWWSRTLKHETSCWWLKDWSEQPTALQNVQGLQNFLTNTTVGDFNINLISVLTSACQMLREKVLSLFEEFVRKLNIKPTNQLEMKSIKV